MTAKLDKPKDPTPTPKVSGELARAMALADLSPEEKSLIEDIAAREGARVRAAIAALSPAERAAAERTIERQTKRAEAPRMIVAQQGSAADIKFAGDPAVATLLMADCFATADGALAGLLLSQILNATVAGEAVNVPAAQAMLATVNGIAPRDETEALLAVQMAAIHNATMTSAWRLQAAQHQQVRDSEATILTKLSRTFAAQLEALRKHRAPTEQKITVMHVHVNDGGQAVVAGGDLTPGGGGKEKTDGQPHEHGPSVAVAISTSMPGDLKTDQQALPGASDARVDGVPVPRRKRRRTAG